jgi:hypothetical protein
MMTPKVVILAALAAAGGIGAAVFHFRKQIKGLVGDTEDSLRGKVVSQAMTQIGKTDPQPYWVNVTGTPQPSSLSWCGAFALSSLHQAGLALNKTWQLGKGFLLTSPALKATKTPKPGDIAYYDHYQHHAVVAAVYPDNSVDLINGNGNNKSVSPSHTKMSNVTAFYSIQPFIDQRLGHA